MLALLPLLDFIGLFILLLNLCPRWTWRLCFLRTAVVIGAYGVLSVELLSLIDIITLFSLTLVWSVPLLGIVITIGTLWKHKQTLRLPKFTFPTDWFGRISLISIAIILIITAFLAWVTPPQTWDSINYHLSRVAHWAQNKSLKPFATGIEIQNSIPPGAELGMLHLYVLAGGDRFVNFIEWFSMVGSVIAVSFIASRLGASNRGQRLAALFVAALPMGIVQASSSMTDYVVTFWILCAVAEVLALDMDPPNTITSLMASIAAGLAILTKPIAYAYLLPFAIFAAFSFARKRFWRPFFQGTIIAIGIVGLLNCGYFIRTTQIYGSTFAGDQVSRHANEVLDLRGLTSNVIRNTALHIGTPSAYFNKAIYLVINQAHNWIGLDVDDPRTGHGEFRIKKPTTNEVTIGNPIHALVILVIILIIILRRRNYSQRLIFYSLLSLSSFFIFSFVFKWQLFGSRYHLPFFTLMAPVIGIIISQSTSQKIQYAIAATILIGAWPPLMSIQSRPILPDDEARVGSVLVESRQNLYFGNGPNYQDPYLNITERIMDAGCESVGLALSGGSAEYLFWVLLGAPREDLRIEWIVSGTPSARFVDPDFQACAVICDHTCPPEWDEVNNLPLTHSFSGYRLFLGDNSSDG